MEKELEFLFLNVFKTNKDRIFRICFSYSNNVDDAKDLFQEVVLNIWKSLPSFNGKSNINTWIYRVTLNVCLRAKEFAEKRQKLFVKLESLEFNNIVGAFNPTDHDEQFLKLTECIKKLEGIEKTIILLHLEELLYKEIAQVTGLTENYVAVKIKRIKSKLLTCLKS
jgi:RNA polymerase sigma factor (sigma-70 family)